MTNKVAAGHADGLDGSEWATSWLEARKAQGLDASVNKCMLPAFSPSEGWMKRRMRADEFNRGLKRLPTMLGAPPSEKQLIGSHSSKVTLLSWSGKFRVGKVFFRSLGYHATSKDNMPNLYSRDELAAPLRQMKIVEGAVAAGDFDPDATRSG